MTSDLHNYIARARPQKTGKSAVMTSIWKRPLDIIVVFIFVQLFIVAITVDFTQSVYGSVLASEELEFGLWPPAPILKAFVWWCENVDTLVGQNPMWYETMAWFSPFVYAPFYIVAIYAFIYEKEWIRVPALMWGWTLLISNIVILREQIYGPYAAKNLTLLLSAYGGFVLMPILVMIRVAQAPVFSSKDAKKKAG